MRSDTDVVRLIARLPARERGQWYARLASVLGSSEVSGAVLWGQLSPAQRRELQAPAGSRDWDLDVANALDKLYMDVEKRAREVASGLRDFVTPGPVMLVVAALVAVAVLRK